MKTEEATEFVTDQIALAAKKAWENREEAFYANEFGRAPVGMCRRVCYNDGSAQMWGDVDTATFDALEGGSDSGIELIYTFDKDNESFNFEDNAKMHVHTGTISRYRAQQTKEIYTIETHIVRFGDVAFSTNPFDFFLF